MLHLDDEHHQNQNPSSRLGLHHHAPDSAFHNNLMDLTLGNSTTTAKNDVIFTDGTTDNNKEGELEENGCTNNIEIEKEHMFDKVVTPSDVGKLNRLVIPKQHAERYFPLDSSSTISSSSSNNNNVNLNTNNTQKGLLLNFEDCNGKLWRFRYSYWNSSQSYVMTKGWSRFVKDKSLDAGDIVSFHRGLRDSHRHRLYIDCRHRSHHHHPPTPSLTPFFLPNNQYSVRWAGRLYSLPPAAAPQNQGLNYQNYPFQLVQQQQQQQRQQLVQYQQVYGGGGFSDNNLGSGPSVYGLPGDRREAVAPMIIDSVPVAHHGRSGSNSGGGGGDGNNGKKLRLFGVNMEYCCSSSSSPSINNDNSPAINMPNSNLREEHSEELEEMEEEEEQEEEEAVCFSSSSSGKGETSVLFDLSPSFQYRPSSS